MFAALNSAVLAAFGESVEYRHDATTVTITAAWESNQDERIAGVLLARDADLPSGYAKNDAVERGGLAYRVAGFLSGRGQVEPSPCVDDAGMVKIALRTTGAAS